MALIVYLNKPQLNENSDEASRILGRGICALGAYFLWQVNLDMAQAERLRSILKTSAMCLICDFLFGLVPGGSGFTDNTGQPSNPCILQADQITTLLNGGAARSHKILGRVCRLNFVGA